MADLTLQLWQKYLLAMLVGLLVGLEREHRQHERKAIHFAGIRTFPLIALLGCTAAMLSASGQVWLFAIGFAGLSVLVLAVYAISTYLGEPVMTTEVAVLLAAAANTLAKGRVTIALASPPLCRRVLPVLGLLTLSGLGLAVWTI